jgi:bifunctional UDP-N-acetylglucosamine pyrophosphorylase/glucosamine-1-phosphate N-acetyltransferase
LKAVILAAGKGTRLWPLTKNTPKPLLPVAGRPLLEWMILRVREAGVTDIMLVTNYLEEQIRAAFGDGSSLGVNIAYAHQAEMLGTADAFRAAERWVGGDAFLGLYGDHYLSEGTLRRIRKAHREGEVTVGALEVADPSQYGAFALDGDRVTRVVEKPPRGEEPSGYANVGIYVFPPSVFRYIAETARSVRGEYEITDTLQLMIDGGVTVRKHDLEAPDWLDIGLPWTLLEANERAMGELEKKIEGTVEAGARLHGAVWVRRGARVRSGSYVEGPAIIGEDGDVGPNCYIRAGTCLGRGVRVGNACEVKNSIIMDGTHAAHLSYIGDSILGRNCNLGAGTITANLRFDKSNIEVTVKGERLDSGRRKLGVIMGDDVQTGVNVSVHPGVVIGPGAWIAPGLTVQRDVPADVIRFNTSGDRETQR